MKIVTTVDARPQCRRGYERYSAVLRGKASEESHILKRLGFKPKEFILAAVHNVENIDELERLRAILKGLVRLTKEKL